MRQTDREWAQSKVERLPVRWQRNMLDRWHKTRTQHPGGFFAEVAAEREANIGLRGVADSLYQIRIPLDAKDSEICTAAEALAARCWEVATLYPLPDAQRQAMARICNGQDVEPPDACKVEDGPAMARMLDPIWWRRQLRKVHAKRVEGAAIALGYVNKARDKYVSNESVWRRAQQNERNAMALENTTATNEDGQEYTLAELAAKGPANKAIRRAELMTRIAGFERIARDMGHQGIFGTVTCPSFMHKWTTTKAGGVVENRHYRGTLPNEAQKHLAKVWARTRASLARQGVAVYGFRIAEPNHDGTPHWHMLFFVAPEHVDALQATLKKYALQVAPDERGADQHRVDFKLIDGRGAAGYIAKYVAKNLDGFALKTDLCGGKYLEADGVTTAHRVEAWASTWGIRQFQQVGGPPVGPWRELRRVAELPAGAPKHLADAHDAANRIADVEAGTVKAVAWDRYVKAQGGVFVGRDYLVRVAKAEAEGVNKYGEPNAPKPCGVETTQKEIWFPEWMAHIRGRSERVVHWFVESVRRVWTITRKAAGEVKREVQSLGEALAPWTCVNNCTEPSEATAEELAKADADYQRINRTAWGMEVKT